MSYSTKTICPMNYSSYIVYSQRFAASSVYWNLKKDFQAKLKETTLAHWINLVCSTAVTVRLLWETDARFNHPRGVTKRIQPGCTLELFTATQSRKTWQFKLKYSTEQIILLHWRNTWSWTHISDDFLYYKPIKIVLNFTNDCFIL